MRKRTKNHIKYKKNYIIVNGEKCAPFRVEISYDDYDWVLDDKLLGLAERNSGVETGSGYGCGERDISFDFFTKKGLKQFVKKAETRYNLKITVYELQPQYEEVDPTYV